MIKKKYLTREYFENDILFYKQKMNIDCWEQMQYQSLRDYSVDYVSIFCNDINVELNSLDNDGWFFGVNDLGYKDQLLKFVCVTDKFQMAEQAIRDILEMDKVVVYQTAFDFLHTSVWFHDKEPYTRMHHNAIIIGYDSQFFFYVDSPPMRNLRYFISHPNNSAVGCIPKEELIESFKYRCRIGYFDVNEKEFDNQIPLLGKLNHILLSFSNTSDVRLTGKKALVKLAELLSGECKPKGIFDDVFTFDLIKSRHKILKVSIETNLSIFNKAVGESLIGILDLLYLKWEIIEAMAIKYSYKNDISIQNEISSKIIEDIIPLTEQFMLNIGKLKMQ